MTIFNEIIIVFIVIDSSILYRFSKKCQNEILENTSILLFNALKVTFIKSCKLSLIIDTYLSITLKGSQTRHCI
jgi:hypothetical protein